MYVHMYVSESFRCLTLIAKSMGQARQVSIIKSKLIEIFTGFKRTIQQQ